MAAKCFLVVIIILTLFGRIDRAVAQDLTPEAVRTCKTSMEKYWLPTGQSYVTRITLPSAKPHFVEARSVETLINAVSINEALKLNGIAWMGVISLSSEVVRFTTDGAWGPWGGRYSIFRCELKNLNGKWESTKQELLSYNNIEYASRPTPDEVPR